MNYISLFSGIEAATVAWQPLGWHPIAFSEVDPYCCDLLAKWYPETPNLGDVCDVDWRTYAGSVDVVVGGSPCQAFSVAGNRRGLLDERSALMLEFIRAIRDINPCWVLFENVPGVLSQQGGNAFETLLNELEQCGYSLAWRILDAQFFGVAQRRRRVFVVGHSRVGAAAAVLFERESLRWDSPSSREKRASLTGDVRAGATLAFSAGQSSKSGSIAAGEEVAPTIRAASSGTNQVPVICLNDSGGDYMASDYELSGTLCVQSYCHEPIVCLGDDNGKASVENELAPAMKVGNSNGNLRITDNGSIRRLTPVECERLQGFPDGWTDIYRDRKNGTPHTLRYKAIGNSMAVPVMRWIGSRIQAVDDIANHTPSAYRGPGVRIG